jgi:hypothetical protein
MKFHHLDSHSFECHLRLGSEIICLWTQESDSRAQAHSTCGMHLDPLKNEGSRMSSSRLIWTGLQVSRPCSFLMQEK